MTVNPRAADDEARIKSQLRAEARGLAHKKLGGSTKINEYRWISSTARTPAELEKRVAELDAMPDRVVSTPVDSKDGEG